MHVEYGSCDQLETIEGNSHSILVCRSDNHSTPASGRELGRRSNRGACRDIPYRLRGAEPGCQATYEQVSINTLILQPPFFIDYNRGGIKIALDNDRTG